MSANGSSVGEIRRHPADTMVDRDTGARELARTRFLGSQTGVGQ